MRAISCSFLAAILFETRLLGSEVDKIPERQAGGRFADDDLGSISFGAVSESEISSTRAEPLDRRIMTEQAFARQAIGTNEPSGAIAAGGTFISERTARKPETRSISQLISAAAATSSA